MFGKNILFACRNFSKNKAITAIHILGLAVGISASLVIFLIVRYDFSYDTWEPARQDIYRVYTREGGDKTDVSPGVSMLAPEAIKASIPGVDIVSHFIDEPFYMPSVATDKIKNGKPERFTNVQHIAFADENYFKIFPHQWLAGNPQSLSRPNTVVLSLSDAKTYFPRASVDQIIGRRLVFQDSISVVVSGVVADIKARTDIDNRIFISLKTMTQSSLSASVVMESRWTNVDGNSKCFVLLHPGTDAHRINTQLMKLYGLHQQDTQPKDRSTAVLQPLSDLHFNMELGGTVSSVSLRNLGLLAFLLLLLAAINFVNLSTARSSLRAKEIGVRKSFGGNNRQIICQFLTETFLITFLATLLAVILSPLLLHVFRDFVPQGLGTQEMLQPGILAFLILLLALVTVLAGAHPAFVLTKFRPALVLKDQFIGSGSSRGVHLRKVLTVGQFVVAQVFLIAVIVIGRQMHFVLNQDLGFRKNAIVSFSVPDFQLRGASKKYVLMNELKGIPQIQHYSLATAQPVLNGISSTRIVWNDQGVVNQYNDVHVRNVDSNYLKTFDLRLLAGRNLHMDTNAKVMDVLINETFLHQMGLHTPEAAIGQYIKGGPADSARIVGVVKDFTTMSLYNPIQSTAIFADNANWGYLISLALDPAHPAAWRSAMDRTEQLFKIQYPDNDINFTFLDASIEHLYKNDLRVAQLLKWATGLAIFISCLGLLGLVSFMANQRIKEIGIRKVLGASVLQIIVLLSRSLVRLVILASVIAFPIAWYFTHKWLQDFSIQTHLSWWIFAVSAVGMLMVALTVLCLRALKSAKVNPVNSLKSE